MNQAERKIKRAFDLAIGYHTAGDSPNDAIIKTASECELNPEMTRRVVEQFNIAKTNATLSRASDKTASFPLAEIGPILKKAFVETKIENKKQAEYVSSGSGFRVIHESPDLSFGKKAERDPDVLSEWIKQAYGFITESNNNLSKLAQDQLSAELGMRDSLKDLVDYFSLSDSKGKFAEFECDVLSEYGDGAKDYLNNVHELLEVDHSRFGGNVKIGSYRINPTEAHKSFDKLMNHSEEWIRISNLKQAALEDIDSKKAQLNSMVFELSGVEMPDHSKKASDLLFFKKADGDQKGHSYPKTNMAIGLASAPVNLLNSLTAPISGENGVVKKLVGKHMDTFSDQLSQGYMFGQEQQQRGPREAVDQEIDNVKRKAILQDILSNDEILSQQEPHTVQSAYNVLLHLAPETTLNHGVTSAFLRSAIANQAVDPFTAKQIGELQAQIHKNKILAKGTAVSPGL